MKKKILITIITICILILFCIPYLTYATTDINSIYNNPWGEDDTLKNKVSIILGLIQVIGYVTAVIMAVTIGIKWILASPEGKVDLKKTLYPYLIGCVIITAGTTIVSVIAGFGKNLF